MSEIAELRDLQREYIEKRDHFYDLIRIQDRNLLNGPLLGSAVMRQVREREESLRSSARDWQKRVDAIQKKLDDAIGLGDE